jgi:uncharacterized membrane protein YjgN (DUF898 family)
MTDSLVELEAGAPAPAPVERLRGVEPLSFTGTGGEYFRIWIVNAVLTILTLGVYSAWAKVRRLQFFYRHTRLAGCGFDYHGDPIAILKGRLVGLALFVAYSMAGYAEPIVALAIFALIGLLLPWLLSRALRFRFRNSSYRGLRFRFTGSTGGAYVVFLAWPILTLISFGLLGPLWHAKIKRYQHAHAAFGATPFEYDVTDAEFYLIYVAAAALFLGLTFLTLFVAVGIAALLSMGASAEAKGPGDPGGFAALAVAAFVFIAYAAIFTAMQSIVAARVLNLVWSKTRIAGHAFLLQLSVPRLFFIRYTNLLGTLATFGLYRPFAQVRLMRYVTAEFSLLPNPALATLDAFAAADDGDVGALGEEAAELFDIDIAF